MWKKIKGMFEKFIGKIMENKYMIFLKYLLSEFISWAKTSEGVIFIVAWATIAYVIYTFNTQIMYWYNDNIIPFLDLIESNILLYLLTLIILIYFSWDIYKKCKVCYQFDKHLIFALLFLFTELIVCRLSEDYDYHYIIKCISLSYVDVITIFCFGYLYVAIHNNMFAIHNKRYSESQGNNDKNLLNDWPIESASQDQYGFKNDVGKIVNIIKGLNSSKTWSLAINGSWGAGKTSFINLIKEKIEEKDDYEVIKFNPRTSKSASHIQEDFFNTLASKLSEYDSRCSYTLKAYMVSLQLIDQSGIINKLVDFYSIWNKDNLKESIQHTISSLRKKILVVIDDFDRLTREEIFEVLKLIDSNAAFKNIIFLTAYDKGQVNNILKDFNKPDEVNFIDKFFNLEYSLPMNTSSYLMNTIYRDLGWDNNDKKEILDAISNHKSIFNKYIHTPRDAKRYINQFVVIYEKVAGEVITDEFLLVQLIKYLHPELFNKIYQGQFTEPDSTNFDLISLKKDLDQKNGIWPILNELFNNRPANVEQSYRHIYSKKSFDSYFTNQINYPLRMKDMNNLFSQKWNVVTKVINGWLGDNAKTDDFIAYLNCIYHDKNKKNILTYTRILAYLACKTPDQRVYKLFMRSICISELNVKHIKQKLFYAISYSVRGLILNKEYDPKLDLTQRMHFDYVRKEYDPDNYLIKDDDIRSAVKDTFISSLNSSGDEEYIFRNLCNCIESNNVIDKDCAAAYRKHIETYPNWYIQNFVGLGMVSSSPDWNTVDCRQFWRQIFGDERQIKEYLKQCKEKNIEKANLAWNFWRLFEANGYNPIEFDNQGNVQDKIDNNLVKECKLLDKLLNIQKKANNMSKNIELNKDKLDSNDKKIFIEILNKNMNDLNNVKLYIKLNGDIRKEIEQNLKILAKE